MTTYLATAMASSMIPDGPLEAHTISVEHATEVILSADEAGMFRNICNPSHANTLAMIDWVCNFRVSQRAEGGRHRLQAGDILLVAELDANKLPRETREFTDEEVQACGLRFRLFPIGFRCQNCGA